jgi:hypothetical protein
VVDFQSLLHSQTKTGIDAFQLIRTDFLAGIQQRAKELGQGLGSFDVKASRAQQFQPKEPTSVVAMDDFRSQDTADLWFERGEEIKVLAEHKSGWWIGEIETTDESGTSVTRKGLFPESYVQKKEALAGRPAPVDAIFLARDDFDDPSAGTSRLVLVSGDLVMVDLVLKGRCHGTNLRTNAKGYFPLAIIDGPGGE